MLLTEGGLEPGTFGVQSTAQTTRPQVGLFSPGPGRAGQGRAGQGRAGQGRAGQALPGQAGQGRAGAGASNQGPRIRTFGQPTPSLFKKRGRRGQEGTGGIELLGV